MKIQIEIASEPKYSNLASTLAHETRKNNAGRILFLSLCVVVAIAGAAIITSCDNDDEPIDDDPYKDARAACELKTHADSAFVWNQARNRCEGTFTGDPFKDAKAECAAKTHADSAFVWDAARNRCVGTFTGDPFKDAKAECAAKTHADSTFLWDDAKNRCVGTYTGPTTEEKIAALKAEIAELVADSAATIKAARAALWTALTVPTNLTPGVWNQMNTDHTVPRETFLDTLNYIIDRCESFKATALEHGWDFPNEETMEIYIGLGEYFKEIVASLKAKRSALKDLQNITSTAILQRSLRRYSVFESNLSITKYWRTNNVRKNMYACLWHDKRHVVGSRA